MNVPEMVQEWFEQHADRYDGLTNSVGCFCVTGSLFECGCYDDEGICEAGHISGADENGDIVFTAGPRPEAAT